MIYSSVPSELDTSLRFFMHYKTYHWVTSYDTTQKYILYEFKNNYSTQPGEMRVSKTAVYKDGGTNHNQPYIKVYRDTISDGFNGSSLVTLNGSNWFRGDTLIVNFHVSPLTGSQYNQQCKYLKL